MPIASAARRASCASSLEQQPRAPVRNDWGFLDSARWTPVTSWPASTARAAATAESTPPDIAARTFTRCPFRFLTLANAATLYSRSVRRPSAPASSSNGSGEAGPRDSHRQRRGEGVDVGGGRRVPQGEPQRRPSLGLAATHGQQDMAGLRHPGRAGRTGRAIDVGGVEEQEQGVGRAARKADVHNPRQRLSGIRRSMEYGVRYGGEHVDDQQRTQLAEAPFLGIEPFGRALEGGGETRDCGDVEGAGANVSFLAAAVQDRSEGDIAAGQ